MQDDDREGLNPWVVLTDCTIALVFILVILGAIITMAGSQALSLLERQKRQESFRLGFFAELQKTYPRSHLESFRENERRQRLISNSPGGAVLAEVYENASYQRLCIYTPQFKDAGSPELDPTAQALLVRIGNLVLGEWSYLDYLDIDGIAKSSVDGDTQLIGLSRQRADRVLELFQARSIVSRTADAPKDKLAHPTQVPLKFTVPYGLGDELYSAGFPLDNRVDLVLFYKDVGT